MQESKKEKKPGVYSTGFTCQKHCQCCLISESITGYMLVPIVFEAVVWGKSVSCIWTLVNDGTNLFVDLMVNLNNFQSTIHSTGCVIPSLFYFCFTIYLYSLRNCIPFFEHTGATRQTASQRITKKRSNIPVVEKMISALKNLPLQHERVMRKLFPSFTFLSMSLNQTFIQKLFCAIFCWQAILYTGYLKHRLFKT